MGEKILFKALSKLRVKIFQRRWRGGGRGKEDELKLRVDLWKEGEICQAGCIKGPMTASTDFKGQ